MSLSDAPELGSINGSGGSSKTWTSKMSWSAITQNKWDYVCLLLGLVWLAAVSVSIVLSTVWFNSNTHPWSDTMEVDGKSIYLSYQQFYYLIFITFEWTIIFICIFFLFQYFVLKAPLPTIFSYRLRKKVPGAKHTISQARMKQRQQQRQQQNNPSRPLLPNKNGASVSLKYDRVDNFDKEEKNISRKERVKSIALNREKAIPRTNYPYTRCGHLCQYAFGSHWSLFNAIASFVIIYHLLQVICLITSIRCEYPYLNGKKKSVQDSIIEIIYHLSRALSDTLPGFCLIMYWRARAIYDPNESFVKKFERRLLSHQLRTREMDSALDLMVGARRDSLPTDEKMAADFAYNDNTKTLAAVHSILSKCAVKSWLFFAMFFCLYHFLFWPQTDNSLWSQLIQESTGDCIARRINSQDIADAIFVIDYCILRPFNGMILIYTIWLILPIGVTTHTASKLKGFKSIMSPTIIGLIILFGMLCVMYTPNQIWTND